MTNLLVPTSWSYKDALIQTYTLPYLKLIARFLPEGSRIVLVTQEQDKHQMSAEEIAKADRELAEHNIILYRLPWSPFSPKVLLGWVSRIRKLLGVIRRENITVIHAWAQTGGAIGYLLSRFSGKPLVIDSYEPHAEALVENGTWSRSGLAFRISLQLEKWQSRRAKTVIALTEGMRDYAKKTYGASFDRYYVKPSLVDFERFSPPSQKDQQLLNELGLTDKLVLGYAGKFGGIYLEEPAFEFLAEAVAHWGDRLRILLLTDTPRDRIEAMAKEAGIDPKLIISRFLPHTEIPHHLALMDMAINPVKPVPTKRYCTSIKDGEYWAMGLPVVLPANISDDSDHIRENRAGVVIDGFNPELFPQALKEMDVLLQEDRKSRTERIREMGKKYRNFGIAEAIYRELYL